MPFGIGTNTQEADEGELRGTFREVAVACWFTSTGRAMPIMLKFQDEEGMIRRLENLRVCSSCKKRYAGIPILEYACTTLVEGREYPFLLQFYPEKCEWRIFFNKKTKDLSESYRHGKS